MGFTTGFLGGITLTYSIVYLSVYIHRQNRTHQSLLLRQQARLLDSKVDPPTPEYEPPAYRTEKAGLEEQLKDRWNRELESNVRKLQNTDWEAVRIRWENRISHVFNKIRNTEQVQEAEQKLKDTAADIKDSVVEQADQAKQKINTKATEVKQAVSGKTASAKQDAKEAVGAQRLLEVKI